MRTRKLTLTVSVFLTICILTTVSAHAGILNWFASHGAQTDEVASASFDSMYTSIMSSAQPAEDLPVLSGSAIASVNSPVGGVRKTLRRSYFVSVSAYNSEVAQTDASPFIGAMGTHVRDGMVASNMFPFGTVLKIPSLFGDKLFVVEDRMNTRFQNNVDVWMVSKADAIKLGRRTVKIEVIQ